MSVLWGKSLNTSRRNRRQEGAKVALLTLTAINLLNFADRYLPNALKDPIKDDLGLTDAQTSIPASSMLLVYMGTAPLFGMLNDSQVFDRRAVLAFGVAFWSLATGLAGYARNLWQLVLFRSLVGVGEAAYGAICPPLIADFFPVQDRNIAFMMYQLASSVGGALGFIIAGILGGLYSWRVAFLALGLPGMLFAAFLPRLNDPARGVNDDILADNDAKYAEQSWFADAWQIVTNKHWLFASCGQIATSFAIGGFAEWYAALLSRDGGMSMESAALYMGFCTVVGGICGTVLGAKTAQYFDGRVSNSSYVVAGAYMIPCAICAFLAVNLVMFKLVACVTFLLAITFVFTPPAPMAAVSVNCMPVRLRSRAFSLQIFLVHALGDVLSPPLIGMISDRTGSLQSGLQLVACAVFVAAVIWLTGACVLPPLPVPPVKEAKADTKQHNSMTVSSLFCGSNSDDEFDLAVGSYGSNDETSKL